MARKVRGAVLPPPDSPLRQAPSELAQQLGAEGEQRNPLIPLPTVAPDSQWRTVATTISQQYKAQRLTGRTSHLADTDLVAALLAGIDEGLSPQQSAIRAGLSADTLNRWMETGQNTEDKTTPFARFTDAAKSARESRRHRLLSTISRASELGPQYWTAAAWSLERGYGNDYKLNPLGATGSVIVNIGIMGRTDIQVRGESGPQLLDSALHNDVVLPGIERSVIESDS